VDRWHKALIAVLLAIVVGVTLFALGYSLGAHGGGGGVAATGASDDGVRLIDEAYGKIRSSASDPPSRRQLVRGAVKGMVDVLHRREDPYALFYSPRGYQSFQELTTGRFSGIGVWLKQKHGRLEVVSVLPSTPAIEAGMRRGDVLEEIDGRAVGDLTVDEAVGLIKGRAGTTVSLSVARGGASLRFTITRASIQLPNLVSRMTDDDLGYIRLLGFARGAGKQVRDEVSRLRDEGAAGIVLDLRDNGGGLFSEGIDVANVFIEEGHIVTYRGRSRPEHVYEAEGTAFEEIPLVVLVNEGTASASEIVAGALQDRDRAILVGQRTYGKGSVQEVFPLSDASALKLTTGAYFTPSGRNISGEGIEPDVEIDAARSAQRQRAVEILKGIVISSNGAQG
jgi:carboxyl-terminal processing protease